MENSEAEIQKAISEISYGLYIVSSMSGKKMNGQLVNTVFQAASCPPLVAASINKSNLTHAYIEESGIFSISVLAQDTPMPFIGLFGFRTGREIDKFKDISFKLLAGCPAVTENALAVLAVKTVSTLDMGTHTLFLGEVLAAETLKEGPALTYEYYKAVKHGKTHKNATTFYAGADRPA